MVTSAVYTSSCPRVTNLPQYSVYIKIVYAISDFFQLVVTVHMIDRAKKTVLNYNLRVAIVRIPHHGLGRRMRGFNL